jgi:pseudaminic acid cytidylyltransferase
MPSRLAVIPARGGSKRIPDKNIRDFCGRPMIAYILASASMSGLFDTIHVSTDSPRIATVAEDLGFAPQFARPAELADDQTPLMPVLKYVLNRFIERGSHFDEVWLLMACAPLIEADDLRHAARMFAEAGSSRPLLPIAPYPAPIEWAYDLREDGNLDPVYPGMFAVRSQDLKTHYYDSGSFYIFPARHVLESAGAGKDSGFIGHVLPRYKAVDIDNELDWETAEYVLSGIRARSWNDVGK